MNLKQMKLDILDISKKKIGEVNLPTQFQEDVRADLVKRAFLAFRSNKRQAYGTKPEAGKRSSSILSKRRRKYRGMYGFGISRTPRKILSRRGTRMFWVGAFSPNTVGGRRAHPPKAEKILEKKINKKEMNIALTSAISATANEKEMKKKYERLKDKKIEMKNLPFIVESKIISLKTKNLLESLKKIFGKDLFDIALKKKKVRSGKGKLRGRKYKSNAGMLLVTGKNEEMKTKLFEISNTNNLSVTDLAKGTQGRLVIYTEQAIKDLGEKFK